MSKRSVGRPRSRSTELANIHFTVEKHVADKVIRLAKKYYGNRTLWFCELIKSIPESTDQRRDETPDYEQLFLHSAKNTVSNEKKV